MNGEKTQVQILAEFAWSTKVLSPEIVKDTKERILDVLGNCLAGRAESQEEHEPDRAIERILKKWGGTPTSTVIGSDTR